MNRAKFKTLEAQREFFMEIKEKLGLGAKKLSKKLELKSRGSIESYTFMRSAPPVKIVKKLEKLSGVKAVYEEITGKIYRKKRKFTPIDPEEAKIKLKKRFGKDFSFLDSLIKSKLTIKEIILKIRSKKYSFDNSKVGRWIGAYRTNLLSEITEEVVILKEEISLKGHIRRDKKTLSINFNLSPLYKLLEKIKIRVGLKISEKRDRIKLFPLNFGRKLIRTNGGIKILLTEKSGLKIKSNVEIILRPKDFGISLTESIYDDDAKSLIGGALRKGFVLDNIRSTPSNHKGDLSLYMGDKNVIIEITRANSYKSSYFKIGQCFVQKLSWPNSIQFLICKEKFLSRDCINSLSKLNVKIIYSNFKNNWEKETIEQIWNQMK
jgi:hypothetical protein